MIGLQLPLPQTLRPEKSETVGGRDDTFDKENLKKRLVDLKQKLIYATINFFYAQLVFLEAIVKLYMFLNTEVADIEWLDGVSGSSKEEGQEIHIPVSEVVYGAMLPADVQQAVEKKIEMALQDRVMEETKDKKNAVEAYVYDIRNKLHDKLFEFVTDSDREQLIAKLQEPEDWLYEDGEDEIKGVYVAKLYELKKQCDPIEQHYKEHSERCSFVGRLVERVNWFKQAAVGDPKYDHIDMSEKQKVLSECSKAENWLREAQQVQDGLPKHAEPVLLSADIRKREEAINMVCRPILSKPKPAPPKLVIPKKPASSAPASLGLIFVFLVLIHDAWNKFISD
ncbi:heat shock 70 kDa protein 15 [Tanacetum coccineum]|uniref:Heat shock 70 kDa protein 15 n=1 Tax=Tanacetum coccineum TaxID=301880 RepID=A0ABQ5ER98_9ASTR